MNSNKALYINIFSRLGERLGHFGGDEKTASVISEATTANPWFLAEDIKQAVQALCEDMLTEHILEKWLSGYEAAAEARKVAVIMAGNIPLVGFADLLYVIAAGHIPCIKPSSKDTVLMRHVIAELRNIAPEIKIYDYDDTKEYDAVIATGSDNSGRYFRSRFGTIPALIRGSRGSVAVLSGKESEHDLKLLQKDIFSYSGLGCRNVSMIFIPEEYDTERLGTAIAPDTANINPKYYNNYRRTKGELAAAGIGYTDCGTFVMTEGDTFPVSLSDIVLYRYSDMAVVEQWIAGHDTQLQCIVSDCVRHPRAVPFGRAQHPAPWDYPDGIDVMEFLTGLSNTVRK